jgi:hypothetical protein
MITKRGREGPKSNIPSISTMGFSTLILSKAMAASEDDNEDNSCSRRSNKGLTKELTNSEREILGGQKREEESFFNTSMGS